MIRKFCLLVACTCFAFIVEAKLPDLTLSLDTKILDEILTKHAKYHQLNTLLVKRALLLYMEELDPNKTYFIKSDIDKWLNPSDELLNQILQEADKSNFQAFMEIHSVLLKAIERHNSLEKKIDYDNLPKNVKADEFKKITWVNNGKELLNRLIRIRALQIETASKLNEESKEITIKLLLRQQARFDEDMSASNPQLDKRLLVYILKAFASSLDPHTIYFTPDEASQFLIQVQESLEGIGAELRDELNGITITKILPGSPAEKSKVLKVGDTIIAVNGEPVVGMDIQEVVALIRGPAHTAVTLSFLREEPVANGKMHEVKHEVKIIRGEVVLNMSRYESNYIPYGNGGLAYLKLFSFYQDLESSSGEDLKKALQKLKEEYNIKGVILDLRNNPGGVLSQAVAIAGLFIGKGIVVSIKDNNGDILQLRHLESSVEWEGPLIVLENRLTASAAEIVSGTLQDYGRAIVVGDKHTYGKGTYQNFTLNPAQNPVVNPLGEYTVTEGFYYTVSGKTPQLTGVQTNIFVPGTISEMPIGEKYSEYPLEPDYISSAFNDGLKDDTIDQQNQIKLLGLQPKLNTYEKYLPRLIQNSELRIKNNKSYQNYLKEMEDSKIEAEKSINTEGEGKTIQEDFQLNETFNIMRDLLYLMPR